MPVTGTLGALTYSKVALDEENWVTHFTSDDFANLPLRFSSFDTANSLQEEIYIAGALGSPGQGSGFNDVLGQVFALSVLPDGFPRIKYSTEYERNQPWAISGNVDSQQNTINFLLNVGDGFFNDGDLVRFSSVSGVSANVSTTQTYFLRDVFFVGGWVVRLATSPGGPAINLTATGNLTAVMGSLTANTTSGEFEPTDIVFDSFNDRLILSGQMLLALPSTVTPISNYTGIITLDNEGGFVNSQRFLPGAGGSVDLGNVRRPNTRTCSTLVTGNNEIVTSTVYSRPTGGGPAVFNNITRIDNGSVIWDRRTLDISSTNGLYSVENRELLGTTSDGNIITAINIQYPRLVGFSFTADWHLTVYKLNKVDGSTIWRTGTLPVTGGFDTTGPFGGLAIDSNDNIYLSSREDRQDFSSFNTVGSFILKLNNNGEVVWQKHYVANSTNRTQIRHLHIDSSDQIYFVANGPRTGTGVFRPTTALIIGQLDTDGNEIWCNRMNFSTGQNIRPTFSIKKYGTSLYILAENGDNDVGMLFKIPADGNIPGTGNYSIATSSITYDITYEVDSLNISNANMRLANISTVNLANTTVFEFSNAIYDDDPAIITQETRSLK